MRKTRMGKHAGCCPEWLNPRALLLFFEHFDDGVEIAVGLREGGAFRRHVPIVKGVEGGAQFLDKFERYARAITCVFNGIGAVVPRADGRSCTKRVTQNVPEGVPVCHRKAQMLSYRPALDDFGGIVVFEGQRVPGGWAFIGDFADFRKCGVHNGRRSVLTLSGESRLRSEPDRSFLAEKDRQMFDRCGFIDDLAPIEDLSTPVADPPGSGGQIYVTGTLPLE